MVVTENDPALARRWCDELLAMAWEAREQFVYRIEPLADSIAQAVALGEPAKAEWDGLLAELSDGTDREGGRLLGEASGGASRVGADGAFGRAVDALQSMFEPVTGTR